MTSQEIFGRLGTFSSALALAPFVLLLAAVAVFPFLPRIHALWERLSFKFFFSALCALAGAGYYLALTVDLSRVGHTFLDYAAFLALLGALFIISGGIHISGAFAGFPRVNTLLLAVGAILANLLGTTGASMILI